MARAGDPRFGQNTRKESGDAKLGGGSVELLKWRAEPGASEEAGPERVTSGSVEGPCER